MKNSIGLTALILIYILNIGCTQNHSIMDESESRYQEYKRGFEKEFVDHFPAKRVLSATSTSSYSSKDEKKNDIGLLLYQYDVKPKEVDEVNDKFRKIAIAQYKSSDSCLLIVNRFESRQTNESREILKIDDKSLVNRECYSSKYPVPNFVNYRQYNENRSLRLDDTFVIYVLESKKVVSWEKEFGMKANPQMPDNWKNGYSKGVAVSKEQQIVIYWTVIW